MDYLTKTEISPRSFSQGIGLSSSYPVTNLSFSEIIDYLEIHPYDGFMHQYLNNSYPYEKASMEEVLKRFKTKPSAITFGLLANTTIDECPEALHTLQSVEDPHMLLKFIEQHYSMDVRGIPQSNYLLVHKMWRNIFEQNREHHISFDNMPQITFGVPSDFLDEIKNPRTYRHVKEFLKSSDTSSIKTGTSIRTISPEETYNRINELPLHEIVGDNQIVCLGFCGTYSTIIPWNLELAVSFENHSYTLRGNAASSGKGISKETSIVSGFMEMLERYSSGMGCTPNFPEGYQDTQEFRKATQSELEQENSNVLDLNRMSLKIPYQNHSLHWIKGVEQIQNNSKTVYIPAQMVYTFPNLNEVKIWQSSSNGLASGNTLEEAKLHSLFEIIERDGDYNMFYSPDKVFKLNASDGKIAEVLDRYRQRGLTIQVLDLTSEFGIPTYRAFVKSNDQILSGSGTHLDGRIAVSRAICELSPKCLAWEQRNPNAWAVAKQAEQDAIEISYDNLPNFSSGNVMTDLRITEATLNANGYNPIYVNLTRNDIDIPVVRTIVPGLEMPEGCSRRQFKHFLEQSGIKLYH